MKRKIVKRLSTKTGAASFYVVIFTTLILGVITLSFIRIMLGEATRTIDADLAQSAYDSALAGIEDAKSAIIKCNREGKCSTLMAKTNEDNREDCYNLGKYLYGISDKEIQISENTRSDNTSTESQAYTCVKIRDSLIDYRATLSSSTRIKVIPLSVENFKAASKIKISWYSAQNGATNNTISKLQKHDGGTDLHFGANGVAEKDSDSSSTAPLLSAELIQTDETFTFNDLISDGNNSGTDRSLLALYPVREGGTNDISDTVVRAAGNPNSPNTPQYIQCAAGAEEFACNAKIKLPPTLRGTKNSDTAFLVIVAPYGKTDVDFAVQVLDGSDNPIRFRGAQYEVDSTGRANDIYRRVDTRIELGSANFPYPEYVAQIGGTNGDTKDALKKNFWVTSNCLKTQHEIKNDTDNINWSQYGITTCPNSGEL